MNQDDNGITKLGCVNHDIATKPVFANRWYELDTGAWFVRLLRGTS